MSDSLHAVIAFIMRRETVLVAFLLSAVVNTFLSGSSTLTSGVLDTEISVAVFGLLAWFTYKKRLLATWTTILILLVYGSGFLYDGFNVLIGKTDGDFVVNLVKIMVGIYLTWGALIIHRERHLKV